MQRGQTGSWMTSEALEPTLSDILHPTRPYFLNLPKHQQYLGTNAQICELIGDVLSQTTTITEQACFSVALLAPHSVSAH